MLINRALLKEGYSSFSLYILEYCDKNNVVKREQYYIDLLNPEYNILKIAGSSLGFKHSKKLSLRYLILELGSTQEKKIQCGRRVWKKRRKTCPEGFGKPRAVGEREALEDLIKKSNAKR